MNAIKDIIVLLVKKPTYADYCALTAEIETNSKASKSKLVIESGLPSIRIFLANFVPKISQEKYL